MKKDIRVEKYRTMQNLGKTSQLKSFFCCKNVPVEWITLREEWFRIFTGNKGMVQNSLYIIGQFYKQLIHNISTAYQHVYTQT